MTPERLAAIWDAVQRQVSVPPYTVARRVLDQARGIPAENLTPAATRLIVRVAWRYRRQMPPELVPTEVEKAEARWVPKAVAPRRRRLKTVRITLSRDEALDLFNGR